MRLISRCLQSTLFSWLPVLSDVAPPSLRHKAASDRMLQIIEDWPVCADVFEHPPPRLASRCPIWSDMTPVDTTMQWRVDWQSAFVVIYTIVTDPTNHQPGFHLPRQSWYLLNRFQTVQGRCRAVLYKWGLAKSPRPTCDCGKQQTEPHRGSMPTENVRWRSPTTSLN